MHAASRAVRLRLALDKWRVCKSRRAQGTDACAQDATEIATARVMLANCLVPSHGYEEALDIYTACLPAVRAAQGNSHLVRAALGYEAAALLKLRCVERAVAAYQEVGGLYREAGLHAKGEDALRTALHCQQLVLRTMRRESSGVAAAAAAGAAEGGGEAEAPAAAAPPARRDSGLPGGLSGMLQKPLAAAAAIVRSASTAASAAVGGGGGVA